MRPAVACILLLGFCGSSCAAEPPPVFLKSCAPCHGKRGAADTPAGKTLGVKRLDSAQVQKKTDEEIVAIVRKGRGKMPSFEGKLSEPDTKAILAYIRSLRR